MKMLLPRFETVVDVLVVIEPVVEDAFGMRVNVGRHPLVDGIHVRVKRRREWRRKRRRGWRRKT